MTSNKYPGVDVSMAKNVYNYISSLNDDYLKDIVNIEFKIAIKIKSAIKFWKHY